MAYTAGTAMDRAAALLNDVNKTTFSYTVQLPYLKSAYDRLTLQLQMSGALVLRDTSSTILVNAAATTIGAPADLVSVISVKEREKSTTDTWQDVEEVDQLPELDPDTPLD